MNIFYCTTLLIFTFLFSSTNLIAQEADCKSQNTYGDSSANYLEFKIDSDSRKFFFKSVDVYSNSRGGFTLYLPPFGFDTYSQSLTSQQKNSPYHNEIEDLSKVYFAWYPEETFPSDQYHFIEGDLLSDDCFFSDNRRELRRLFRTSSSEIKIDTSTVNGKQIITVTSQSKENKSVSLKIHVETKKVRSPLSFDRDELKKLSDEMEIDNCSYRRMYYHKNQQFIIISKQGRKPSFSISSINKCRFGIPQPGEFSAYELKRLPNQTILIQEYKVSTENEIAKEDPIFEIPLTKKAKPLNEYDLNSAELIGGFMASTFIELTAPLLLIDSDQMKDVNESSDNIDKNNYRPHYTTIVHEDLPEVQKIELNKIKPYNFYTTDAEGKLYKTSVQKIRDIVKYSCEEVFFMPTGITIDYKNRFSSEQAYLAYAEIIIGGEDFFEMGLYSKEGSQEQQRFIQQLKKAELDSLLSDNKKILIKNFKAFYDKTTNVERDYVTYDYLTYHEDVLQLFKAYVNTKKLNNKSEAGNETSFFETLEPLINHYQIDTSGIDRKELLSISRDSLTANYHRDFIRIVEKGLTKSKLLFAVEQDAENGKISSMVKTFDRISDLSFKAIYRDESIKLSTAGFHKSYETVMKSCENMWDAGQIYFNLPFLPLEEGYNTEIYFTNYNRYIHYPEDDKGDQHPTPHITAEFNKIQLKVNGTEKITILGEEKEVFVVKMTSASKLEGLPGINNQTWSRKDDLMVNEDGIPYAKIYMSTSYPHKIYSIQLKDKKVHFIKEDEASNLKDWYLESQSKE